MNKVNYGKNLDKHINLRLTTEQFNYLVNISNNFNLTPSAYIRSVLDSLIINSYERNLDSLENYKNSKYNLI